MVGLLRMVNCWISLVFRSGWIQGLDFSVLRFEARADDGIVGDFFIFDRFISPLSFMLRSTYFVL